MWVVKDSKCKHTAEYNWFWVFILCPCHVTLFSIYKLLYFL